MASVRLEHLACGGWDVALPAQLRTSTSGPGLSCLELTCPENSRAGQPAKGSTHPQGKVEHSGLASGMPAGASARPASQWGQGRWLDIGGHRHAEVWGKGASLGLTQEQPPPAPAGPCRCSPQQREGPSSPGFQSPGSLLFEVKLSIVRTRFVFPKRPTRIGSQAGL